MTFELLGQDIQVEIVHKKNKHIYMRFTSPDTLLVTCHPLVTKREIQSLLEKNRSSLEKMLKKIQQSSEQDHYFQYLGKPYTKVFDGVSTEVSFEGDLVFARDEDMLNLFYKKECKRVFQEEMNRILPSFEHIPPFTLKIRKMKSRWGVNNLGNQSITLNSELLKKDLDLLDYVIIHELCHFYCADHSPKFWAHVEAYYPKYKEARKRLRG